MAETSLQNRFHQGYLPEPNSGCWLWFGACTSKGYGSIRDGPKNPSVHRVSWEIHRGPVPEGMFVLHRCDVPLCVNPDHLFLGTNADNMADMVAKNRQARGESNGMAKLTGAEDVQAIRASVATGPELARLYGVSPRVISSVRNRETWRHVPERMNNA